MISRCVSFVISVFLVGYSVAQTADVKKPLITSDLGGRELGFLTKANEHGVLMLYLAELAKTRSTAKPVQALGELLASTQSEENSRLIQLASGKGMSFKAETPATLKRLQTRIDSLTGEAFDKACVGEIVLLAKESVANYESGAKSKDAEIRAFAEQGLALATEKQKIAQKVAGAGEASAP